MKLFESGLVRAFAEFLVDAFAALRGRRRAPAASGAPVVVSVPAPVPVSGPPLEVPVAPARRSGGGRRALVSIFSFGGFLFFSFLALVFSCGESRHVSDDIPRLPEGCPPVCEAVSCPGCNLQGVTLTGADLTKADLIGAWLVEAHLEGAVLQRAVLAGSHLEWANLEGADLTDADLRGAILSYAELNDAVLRNARLERAALHGADLTGANLEGTDLRRASYDEDTTWPAGFDPEKAGAKRE